MKKLKAEITVETAIVLTIIMVIICSFLYMVLYLHDIVALKSFAYSGMIDGADKEYSQFCQCVKNKINGSPLFVLKKTESYSEDINAYYTNIKEQGISQMPLIGDVLEVLVGNQEIKVVKKMPIDKMYLYKAIKDGFKK